MIAIPTNRQEAEMNPNSGFPTQTPTPDQPSRQRFLGWPSTRLGWWSVGLSVLFSLLMFLNNVIFMGLAEDVPWRQTLLPFYGIGMMACGLAAGILAIIALTWRHERSLLVWLPLLSGLFVVLFILGEFLFPH